MNKRKARTENLKDLKTYIPTNCFKCGVTFPLKLPHWAARDVSYDRYSVTSYACVDCEPENSFESTTLPALSGSGPGGIMPKKEEEKGYMDVYNPGLYYNGMDHQACDVDDILGLSEIAHSRAHYSALYGALPTREAFRFNVRAV